MNTFQPHNFHIPVMGLGYTIDTPVKVARFGISSVISIIEDELVEQMRRFYCHQMAIEYRAISSDQFDYRARRITAYLNLINKIVYEQVLQIQALPFSIGSDLCKYFELLPETSPLKAKYTEMLQITDSEQKEHYQKVLRGMVTAGSIDVNIMSKLDKQNYSKTGEALPDEFCDAMAALRGYANSDLVSSIVFSAGYNPRLYAYIEKFRDFFPTKHGHLKKKVILKVSDFRSAQIQGKILAKRGIFVSEFRIESGLNCGGHAFPTDGFLMGPILEEFKGKRESLNSELLSLCNEVWKAKGILNNSISKKILISVQGGIGTANENRFMLDYYNIDSTGWGSPFLLVPEATNVDEETLAQLTSASPSDYYLSYASPLGVPFNNFKPSSSEKQRLTRISKGRAGSPCYKKFLSSNTEFTEQPICVASREYQHLKIKQLDEKKLSADSYKKEFDAITEKDCLCEGLGASVILKNGIPLQHKLKAVTICPGPNLAYFSKISSLRDMVGHIYGRINILNSVKRPNLFINELLLYIEYFKKELNNCTGESANQMKHLLKFKTRLLEGIEYYKNLLPAVTEKYTLAMNHELMEIENSLTNIAVPLTVN